MKTQLPFLLAAATCAGGCAADPPPFAPVANVAYSAVGADPFWMVTIGDHRIVLTLGPAEGGKGLVSHDYPRVLPRETETTTFWQSGEGTDVISIEARKESCEAGGRRFEDQVRVTLSGRMLQGCGGRLLAGGRR
ncbi:hypothetical protein [Sphingosinicella sp. BN140058]|uniref:hypothetical protein n=1 Tax=Sphingosinicella sp. BN140058 TaxID=1892855 RepID=UPI0010111C8E|nr:hypothetical protein [Sphingosinicella sp. BN140058]QAY75213.1 hypothetical protein ETR14_00695 [Sphingosinicella sp. BN140058]